MALTPKAMLEETGLFAVPLYLQPLQGWFAFGGNSGGGARLATGYFLTAPQADAFRRTHDIGGWPRCSP
ncbi:MAG: hypothetical protein WCK86_13560 [Planctomycetia bacterium]